MQRVEGPVVGVVGGSGGVGASTFAGTLARAAAPSLLVDLDVSGGGIDVLLGLESVPGARWSGLQVGGGHLAADDLASGVPTESGVGVLAADVVELDPAAVVQVVRTAATLGVVVLDLPRTPGSARTAGIACCDLVVLVVRADVTGLVAAHTVAGALGAGVPTGVVVRRGAVAAAEAAQLVGAPLLGVLPSAGPRSGRGSRQVAEGLLSGLGGALGGEAPLGEAPLGRAS